jgi:hypothetical protein
MGSGAKSYMRKGFLIYEEMAKYMRRPLVIYDFAPDPIEFPYKKGKFYFIFYQCGILPDPRFYKQHVIRKVFNLGSGSLY